MELVFSITALYTRFAFTFYLILPTFSSKCLPTLEFRFPVFAEIAVEVDFHLTAFILNTLVYLRIYHVCADVTFHSRAGVAFRAGSFKETFCSHLLCQKKGLYPKMCWAFHLGVKVERDLDDQSFYRDDNLWHHSLLFHMKWQSPSPNSWASPESFSKPLRRSLW